MESWQERVRQRLTAMPLLDRVLAAAVIVVILGLLAYGLIRGGGGSSAGLGAGSTSSSEVPGAVASVDQTTVAPTAGEATSTSVDPTTTAVATTTVVTTTTVATTTDVTTATTAPPPTEAPTTAPPTTAPPTTARAVVTSPPSTAQRFGSFCGFVPGALIDIDLNGRTIGKQTADAKGCVTVDR